jgi:ubiquinone/menaquinone biosynthesis C-methylase UbiE
MSRATNISSTPSHSRSASAKWPKLIPPLSADQEAISDDFVKYWHEVFAARYGIVSKFNHEYAVKNAPQHFVKTIEIGAGDGEHLEYEKLSDTQKHNYYAIDIRHNMVESLQKRFPHIHSTVADCQTRMPFDDDYFDRVLAIHVLEHLPNLPAAIREMHRLCNKQSGVFSVVIPCEGSLAHRLARKISAQRLFESRYKQPYAWFIEREHINRPFEIFEELKSYFEIHSSTYFPIPLPIESLNLCIGLTLRPKR